MKPTLESSVNWNIRDELKGKSLEEIKDAQPKFPYAIAMINVNGDLNLGMALRSAAIFGAEKFLIFGKKKYDKRSTVGAQNYIDVEKHDLDYFYHAMNENMYIPYLIETDGIDFSHDNIKNIAMSNRRSNTKPCFVFGSESDGIPQELLDNQWARTYSIRQVGVLRSLNVSACVSIVAHKYLEALYS